MVRLLVAATLVAVISLSPIADPAPLEVCEGTLDTDCLHSDCNRFLCARQFCQVYVGHDGHVGELVGCTPP